MNLNAAALRLMVEKGLTLSDVADIVAANESKVDTTAAERQRRCRAGKKQSKKCDNRHRRGMSDIAWRKLRQQIFERDAFECQYCGSSHNLTCDHIIPLVRGGTNETSNLATACRSCNSSKGHKDIGDWLV
jgi:5-methylcytosine-specific restriction endonuclease McrA